MLLRVIGGASVSAAAVLAYGVRGRSSGMFGQSVWRGARTRSAVALTFDDGPGESTPELLDILSGQNVRATFFQCGANVRRLPSVARQVADEGHEIGNHTQNHAALYLRSHEFIAAEIEAAQKTIADVTGQNPVLFRAPFGCRWFGLGPIQDRLGLLGVMWTVLGRDWKLPASAIADRIIRGAENGAIFCLHDGRELRTKPDVQATLDAVRRIIPELKSRGYRFETVSELLCPKN